jgi:hypothetical protein
MNLCKSLLNQKSYANIQFKLISSSPIADMYLPNATNHFKRKNYPDNLSRENLVN